MSKSDTYPHELRPDLLDPMLDRYHVDGAYAPQEIKAYVSRSKMPHKVRFRAMFVLP